MIFAEVYGAPEESVCQVGVLCRASARDVLEMLCEGGRTGLVDGTYLEPVAGLYDKYSGAGGDGWLPVKGILPVSGPSADEALRVRQVLLPDAYRCPYYTMRECFDLSTEAYDTPAYCRADKPAREGANQSLDAQAREAAGVAREGPTSREQHEADIER